MHIISVIRETAHKVTTIPMFVASDLHTAKAAAKQVALSCLQDHAEKAADVKVIMDTILDTMPDFEKYKDCIVATWCCNGIDILHIKQINRGYIFNDFVTVGYSVEMIRMDEIPEFTVAL